MIVEIKTCGRIGFVIDKLFDHGFKLIPVLCRDACKNNVRHAVVVHIGQDIVRNTVIIPYRRNNGIVHVGAIISQKENGGRRGLPIGIDGVDVGFEGDGVYTTNFAQSNHSGVDALHISETADGIGPGNKFRVVGGDNQVFVLVAASGGRDLFCIIYLR